jgi:hypothetical protein
MPELKRDKEEGGGVEVDKGRSRRTERIETGGAQRR